MSSFLISDENHVSVVDATVLIDEIGRLQARVAELEGRIGELGQLAYTDPLLDLPNRRSCFEHLERLIARVERYKEPAALMFVDVDGLKHINDSFGHEAGDAALIHVAQLLVSTARKSDFVARLAGDEFAILLEHSDELSAWRTALRVVETVTGSQFYINGSCLPLSVAVGIGAIQSGDTPYAVLNRADKSMYRIKAA